MKTSLSIALAIFCAASTAAALQLHVDSGARAEGADGSAERPFPSPQAAFDKLSELGGTKKIGEKAEIIIRQGNYFFSEGAVVERSASGTREFPVEIVGRGEVNFIGGVRVPASELKEVSDANVLAKLPPERTGKLYSIDLKKAGVKKFAPLFEMGFGFPKATAQTEAFFSGGKLTVARYPNAGTIALGKVVDKGSERFKIARGEPGQEPKRGGSFKWSDDRPARWTEAKSMLICGILNSGWAWHRVRADVDAKNKTFIVHTPLPYGLRWERKMLAVNRYYVSNLLEELDAPGEYFIDQDAGIFYVILDKPPAKGDYFDFSTLRSPMLTLNGADWVRVRNINFSATCGTALWLNSCKDSAVADCEFRNIGACGVSTGEPYPFAFAKQIKPSFDPKTERASDIYSARNRIVRCKFFEIGDDAIFLRGGDNRALRRSGHLVSNCVFGGNSRVNMRAVQILQQTCGAKIEHCHFFDTPFIAILYSGSENIIEKNLFERCNLEFYDSGVVYSGRRPNDCGNIIRYNFFSEIFAKDKSTMMCGVYIDDGSSNHIIEKNIFCRVGTPGDGNPFSSVYFHAGRGNIAKQNFFVDCPVVSSQVWWNDKRWEEYWKAARENQAKDIDLNAYLKKYPYVDKVYDMSPRVNELISNRLFRSSMPVRGHFFLNGNIHVDEKFPNVPQVSAWNMELFEKYFSSDDLAKEILSHKPGLQKK